MNIEYIQTLYDYNYWANRRILQAAAGTPPEAFGSASIGYSRLRDTLVHTLSAEWMWRSRWQGTSPLAVLAPADFPTLDAIGGRWADEERHMRAFLATLGDADLERQIAYTTTKGQAYSNLLWHLMVHVVNHGTQHRSELALLLTELGCSPGDIDLIRFLREHAKKS